MLDQVLPLAGMHVVACKHGQIPPPLDGPWVLAPCIPNPLVLLCCVHVDAGTRQQLFARARCRKHRPDCTHAHHMPRVSPSRLFRLPRLLLLALPPLPNSRILPVPPPPESCSYLPRSDRQNKSAGLNGGARGEHTAFKEDEALETGGKGQALCTTLRNDASARQRQIAPMVAEGGAEKTAAA